MGLFTGALGRAGKKIQSVATSITGFFGRKLQRPRKEPEAPAIRSIEDLFEPEPGRNMSRAEYESIKGLLEPEKVRVGQAESQYLRRGAERLEKTRETPTRKKAAPLPWRIIEEPVTQKNPVGSRFKPRPAPALGKAEVEAIRSKVGKITKERSSRDEKSSGWSGPEPSRALTPAEYDSLRGLFESPRRPRIAEERIRPFGSYVGSRKNPFVRRLRKAADLLAVERNAAKNEQGRIRRAPVRVYQKPAKFEKPEKKPRGDRWRFFPFRIPSKPGQPAREEQVAQKVEAAARKGVSQKLLTGQVQVLRLPPAESATSKGMLRRIYEKYGISPDQADLDHYLVRQMASYPADVFFSRIAEHIYRKTNERVVFPYVANYISGKRSLDVAKANLKRDLGFVPDLSEEERKSVHKLFSKSQPQLERDYNRLWQMFRASRLSEEQNRDLDELFSLREAIHNERQGNNGSDVLVRGEYNARVIPPDRSRPQLEGGQAGDRLPGSDKEFTRRPRKGAFFR